MADIVPTSTSKPVLAMTAVLAALQFILAGGAIADLLPAPVWGALGVILGGIQLGWGIYTTGQVTPWADVVAKVGAGRIVAGPAAQQLTGTTVEVVAAGSGKHRRTDVPIDDETGAADVLVVVGLALFLAGLVTYVVSEWDILACLSAAVGVGLLVIYFLTRPPRRPA